jgi:glucose 1-dehydrogenase
MTATSPRPLQDQAALVTGASSGIGAAIALAFAEAGAKVGVNYHSGAASAEKMVDGIRARGGSAAALKANVSEEEDVLAMFERFVDAFGRIDILVANAGIQQDAPTLEMTAKQWRAVLEVNLSGQFLCAREAARRFVQQPGSPLSAARGKIICMSSVHEVIPWAGHVNYAASKGGVMLMMKTLAQEFAGKQIRVNGIAPGAIKTKINEAVWSVPEQADALLKLIPYGRIGEPADVARAAVWLACDESDYVTGTTLLVDGGMSLYPAFRQGG